jgi:hypothetical protein
MHSDVSGRGVWTQGEIMQYAKMDLAKFTENVKGGRYETRTAARRAAGKADWSNKDRDAAHALINKHWGDDAVAQAKPSKRGKTAKPAKRAAKAAPAKTHSTPPPAKKAAKAAPRATRIPIAKSAPQGTVQTNEAGFLRRTPVTLGAQEPVSTSRMVASAGVIQAYKNVTPLTPIEKLAYDVAVAEFTVNESDEARAARLGHRGTDTPEPKRAPQQKAPPARKTPTNGAAETAPAVAPAPASRPHIAVPTAAATTPAPAPEAPAVGELDEQNLTDDQRAQLKRVREAVKTMPDLGPVIPAPPVT